MLAVKLVVHAVPRERFDQPTQFAMEVRIFVPADGVEKEMALVYLHHAIEKAASAGRTAITSFAEGDEQRLMLMGLKRFTKVDPYNLKEARRKIANHIISKGEYTL